MQVLTDQQEERPPSLAAPARRQSGDHALRSYHEPTTVGTGAEAYSQHGQRQLVFHPFGARVRAGMNTQSGNGTVGGPSTARQAPPGGPLRVQKRLVGDPQRQLDPDAVRLAPRHAQ